MRVVCCIWLVAWLVVRLFRFCHSMIFVIELCTCVLPGFCATVRPRLLCLYNTVIFTSCCSFDMAVRP